MWWTGTYRRQPLHKIGRPNKGKALRNVMTTRGRLYRFTCKGKRPKYVPRARIPLVKFIDQPSNLAIDLTVGCSDAVFKSRIMGIVLQANPKIADLIIMVKLWARKMNINRPKYGTLNSFSLTLLVLTFLQNRGMLSSIQEILPEVRNELIDADHRAASIGKLPRYRGIAREWLKKQLAKEKRTETEPCLAQLMVEFLTTFSCLFVKSCLTRQFRQQVVIASPWTGRFMGQDVAYATYAPSIIIEDPFMAGENCARTLTLRGARYISLAIEKTLSSIDRILEEGGDWADLDAALFPEDEKKAMVSMAKKQEKVKVNETIETDNLHEGDESEESDNLQDDDEASGASAQAEEEEVEEEEKVQWTTTGPVRQWIKQFTREEVAAVKTDDRPVQVQLSWCTPALLAAAVEAMENMDLRVYQGKALNFILSSVNDPIRGVADWEVPQLFARATTDINVIQGKLLSLLESPENLPVDLYADYLSSSLRRKIVEFIRMAGFSCEELDDGMLRLDGLHINPAEVMNADASELSQLNEELLTELYASLLVHASGIPVQKAVFVEADKHLVPTVWIGKMYKHIGKKYLKLHGEKSIYYEGQFMIRLMSPPATEPLSVVSRQVCGAVAPWKHNTFLEPFQNRNQHGLLLSRLRIRNRYSFIQRQSHACPVRILRTPTIHRL